MTPFDYEGKDTHSFPMYCFKSTHTRLGIHRVNALCLPASQKGFEFRKAGPSSVNTLGETINSYNFLIVDVGKRSAFTRCVFVPWQVHW